MEQWHGAARGRIRFALGPHAPILPPEYLKVAALADELEVGIHIHIAETRQEVEDIVKQYGMSPVRLMLANGVFKHPTLAAHCVHLNEDDIAILKDYQVGVAHNPESNMKLASGIAPVPAMLKAGIAVGLAPTGFQQQQSGYDTGDAQLCIAAKVNSMDPTVLPAIRPWRWPPPWVPKPWGGMMR